MVEAIIPYFEEWLSRQKSKSVVWCPFDTKQSPFAQCLKPYRRAGKITLRYSHESDEDGYGDFFKRRADFKADLIISNPPFSRKVDLIKRLSELEKDFCFLLPLEMFSSVSIVDSCIENGIKIGGLIIPNHRVSFNGNRPQFKAVYVTSDGFFNGMGFVKVSNNTGEKIFLTKLTDKEAGLMNASKSLSTISENRDMWIAQYRQEMKERDFRSSMTASLAKGFARGMEKGMEKGIAKGMAQGMEESKRKTALNFLKMGLPVEQVAKGVGLSTDEVLKLSRQN